MSKNGPREQTILYQVCQMLLKTLAQYVSHHAVTVRGLSMEKVHASGSLFQTAALSASKVPKATKENPSSTPHPEPYTAPIAPPPSTPVDRLEAITQFQFLEKQSWANLDKSRLVCFNCSQKGTQWTNKGISGAATGTGTRRLSLRCDGKSGGKPCGKYTRFIGLLEKQTDSDYLDIGSQIESAHQILSLANRTDLASLRHSTLRHNIKMASRKKPALDTPSRLTSPSLNAHPDEITQLQQTLEEIREEANQREAQAKINAERLDKQNADLHKALQRMTEQVEILNARLEAKDKELDLLRTKIATASPAPKDPPASRPTRREPDTTSEMEEVELGEVPEPRRLVHDVIATLKESGLLQVPQSPPVSAQRGPQPRIFSENFDISSTSSFVDTPRSYAAAARNIFRNSASALDAARIVFRSSFPRSTITRLENVYLKASVPSGTLWPKRFLIMREALKTLGIKEGIVDMSFVGGSVVHLLVSNEKVDEVEEALRKAGRLLVDFDPLGVPDLPSNQGRSSTELKRMAHDNCVKRLGNLYARGGQHTKDAVTLTRFSATQNPTKTPPKAAR
ncbi:hypothetical protein BC829DRAFT_422611 [Chytridium lagenaria]|nr:hypothetical protein BC829DRAFT_422611 [Chytridium lagenaria]